MLVLKHMLPLASTIMKAYEFVSSTHTFGLLQPSTGNSTENAATNIVFVLRVFFERQKQCLLKPSQDYNMINILLTMSLFLFPSMLHEPNKLVLKLLSCCCWFSLYFVFIAMTVNLMTKMQRISLFIQSFSTIYVYVTTGARLNYFIRIKEEYAYILNDFKVLIISVN